MIRLSVLDQSPAISGQSQADAVRETVELARLADRLGYHRYWMAEHHSAESFSSAAPEIMTARIAAATTGIRVGPGGVLLAHYSALKVAETFRLLATLFPGRIDLGIGRAPGVGWQGIRALQPAPAAFDDATFPDRLVALIRFLRGDPVADFPGVRAVPEGEEMPELWLLGSAVSSASLAAALGCAFSSAHFINPEGTDGVMRAYARAFRPSPWLAAPASNVCCFVFCADTEDEARDLAATRDLWRMRMHRGERGKVPTVEEALAYEYSEDERRIVAANRRVNIAGTPDSVRAQLLAIAQAYGTEEIVVLTNCARAARFRSYELLAEAFALTPRAT